MIFNTHLYDSRLIVNNFMINNKCDSYKTLKKVQHYHLNMIT